MLPKQPGKCLLGARSKQKYGMYDYYSFLKLLLCISSLYMLWSQIRADAKLR
jgi:hypothetical protein